ncbi:MAG TPA: toll/interleukin-1 receptor domain-containing protein [Ktedonobacteraceae bacterium]|jgi:hypothetical protein
MAGNALELFYSYAHADERLRDQLDKHLKLLQREGFLRSWFDRDISAGKLWAKEIKAHLDAADIILLLISADFLDSDYCDEVEVREALRKHRVGEARVIPVILRPCDWESSFGTLQALPRNGKPVTRWLNRDAAFTDIAKGIRRVIEEMRQVS